MGRKSVTTSCRLWNANRIKFSLKTHLKLSITRPVLVDQSGLLIENESFIWYIVYTMLPGMSYHLIDRYKTCKTITVTWRFVFYYIKLSNQASIPAPITNGNMYMCIIIEFDYNMTECLKALQ